MPRQWSSYRDFFRGLDDAVEYVALRSFENLEEVGRERRDIDILCRDVSKLVAAAGASPFRTHRNNTDYRVYIGPIEQKLDIYGPFDGYYCRDWCDAILNRRRRFGDFVFVPDAQNYFFSLLYQARLLRRTFPVKHIKTLERLAVEIGLSQYRSGEAHDLMLLNNFLEEHDYRFVLPLNWEVRPNWRLIGNLEGSRRPNILVMRMMRGFRKLVANW